MYRSVLLRITCVWIYFAKGHMDLKEVDVFIYILCTFATSREISYSRVYIVGFSTALRFILHVIGIYIYICLYMILSYSFRGNYLHDVTQVSKPQIITGGFPFKGPVPQNISLILTSPWYSHSSHAYSSTLAMYQFFSEADYFMYAPSQWETSLQCNDASHWLGAYLDWSLYAGRLVLIL